MSISQATLATEQAEGEARKEAELAHLCESRSRLIRRAQRAFLKHLLDTDPEPATLDAIGSAAANPPGINPTWRGAAVNALAKAGVIRRAGFAKSTRASRHASHISTWALVDRRDANIWLTLHPERPEPNAGDGSAAS